MAEFAMSYTSGLLPLFVPMGLGPRRTHVRVNAGELTVRMGWAFRAKVPLEAVRSAGLDSSRVTGWGVHGRGGTWLVNGSSAGMVRVEIEPPARARMCGFGVRLLALRLSLQEPEQFLGALGDARQ
jgi:hypothetical protein